MNDHLEHVYQAIWISWKVAHESNSHDDWLRRWSGVCSQIDGMWNLVNNAYRDIMPVEDVLSLLDDISELHEIADHIRYNYYRSDIPFTSIFLRMQAG